MSDFELRVAQRAATNVRKWGVQNEATLILCMAEELGELAQAHLQATDSGPSYRVEEENIDLAALCLQLALLLEGLSDAR